MAIDSTSSSSRCVRGNVTTTHDFSVPDFSALDGMGTGKFISSSTFSAGGCDWRIDLYPDGVHTANQGAYVSGFLYLVRGTAAVSVVATFSLLANTNPDQVMSDQRTTSTKTFQSVGHDWGFSRLIKKSTLRELLRHLNNGGRFTVWCVLTVKDEVLHTEDVDAVVVVPQPKLQKDLIDMLRSGEGADVSFSVGGQLFPAHRCILAARSMVFKAELFGTNKEKEKDAQCIEIEDVEPAVFEVLLHFVYTDSLLDDADDNVATRHLLAAADRYGLDRLRLLCEAKLCRDIDVQTVAATHDLAEQHRCTQLKGACIGFIASRDVLSVVMETNGFNDLVTRCPAIMKEIMDKVAAVWRDKYCQWNIAEHQAVHIMLHYQYSITLCYWCAAWYIATMKF